MSESLVGKLLKNINILKPLLLKLFPIDFLRYIKRIIIRKIILKNARMTRNPFDKTKFLKGITLFGFIKGEIGLGQSCRLMAKAIHASKLDFTIYNYDQVSSLRLTDSTWEHKITNTSPFNINLFHINPPDLILARASLDKSIWDYKYNIGFWLWELEKFPEDWKDSFSLVDEIWTPSNYVTNIIKKQTDKPVKTMVYPLEAPIDKKFNRQYFALPKETFLYLCMYDCNSTIQRKNPISTIDAFMKAFEPTDKKVGLVIKVNNPQTEDLKQISELCSGWDNIYIISKILTKIEVNSLIYSIDSLVSLHRAEGFGLPMAEAMLLGKPVIATNWSSNTDFMDTETACMVDYNLVELEEDYVMYEKGSIWADPKIEEASEYMKRLVFDKKFYTKIGNNAKQNIITTYNEELAGKAIASRIEEIYKGEQT